MLPPGEEIFTICEAKMQKKEVIAVFFIVSLLVSNLMASKLTVIWGFTLPAAVILYPFCFMLGDVLTEVWGYRYARKVIFAGFAANLMMSLFCYIAVLMPAAPGFNNQEAFASVFGLVPRIVVASILGYLAGELSNSFVLDRIKRHFGAKRLYVRTILSSVVGQLFDTGIFITVAFFGLLPANVFITLMVSQYLFKIILEACAGTPLAYLLVGLVRKNENSYGVS